MQGANQRKQKDGTYAPDDILVTIFVNLVATDQPTRYGAGIISYATREGASVISRVFVETQITENGKKLIAAADRR